MSLLTDSASSLTTLTLPPYAINTASTSSRAPDRAASPVDPLKLELGAGGADDSNETHRLQGFPGQNFSRPRVPLMSSAGAPEAGHPLQRTLPIPTATLVDCLNCKFLMQYFSDTFYIM